jgi:hypothetical protein
MVNKVKYVIVQNIMGSFVQIYHDPNGNPVWSSPTTVPRNTQEASVQVRVNLGLSVGIARSTSSFLYKGVPIVQNHIEKKIF